MAEQPPSPEHIDKMVRTHRRRASESAEYFSQHRSKRRNHTDHVLQHSAMSSNADRKLLTLSDFRLSKVLGSGGTATVVKAEPTPGSVAASLIPVKDIALKAVPKKNLNRRAQHFLAREIAIHRNVQDHPHIVSLYEVFEDSSGIYLALELLKGSDLYGMLRRERRGLCERHALMIIAQVFDALQYMHASGCAHRDIKPENLMFTERPNLSEDRLTSVKLIDFGLACARNPNASKKDRMSSEKCGTIRYAAPEIVTETAYIPEFCDIWSVGVVLYSMIAHRNPYSGKTEKEVLHQILHSPLSFDGIEWERVSEDTKTLIRACLNLKPARRPSSANALNEVRRILDKTVSQNLQGVSRGNENGWEVRSARGTRTDVQRGGHDFFGFSSHVTREGSLSNSRREKDGRVVEMNSSPMRSSSDEGVDHPLNIFEGVRALFSGSSPDRDPSNGSN